MALAISASVSGTGTTSNGSTGVSGNIAVQAGDMIVVFVAADNNGTDGASSISRVEDNLANVYTQQAIINRDPGAAAAGVTLGIFTYIYGSSTTIDCTVILSPNTSCECIEMFRVRPGSGNTVEVVAVDTVGVTGQATAMDGNIVSVAQDHTIFGAFGIEGNAAVTADSDTTNGSWSTLTTRLADGGTQNLSISLGVQHKTPSATGNQQYNVSMATTRDHALSYIVLKELTPGGKIKHYNGATWDEKPVKWYNGTTWVEKPLKTWNGASWVLA